MAEESFLSSNFRRHSLLLEVAINTFEKNRQHTTQDLGLREKDKWNSGGRLLYMFAGKRLISCVYNSICGSIGMTFYFFLQFGIHL